jgi:hypothetical protein
MQVQRSQATHFKQKKDLKGPVLPHPIWNEEDVNGVQITHTEPETFRDKLAYWSVQFLRFNFDLFSGFKFGNRTESKWLKYVFRLSSS